MPALYQRNKNVMPANAGIHDFLENNRKCSFSEEKGCGAPG
jgi:hypothetical protein